MKAIRMKKTTPGVNAIIIIFSVIFMAHAIVCIFPVFFTIINALKTDPEYTADILAFPTNPQWKNFLYAFTEFQANRNYFFDMLFNSLWMLVVSVFCNVMSSLLLAYGISKFEFVGKEFLYALVIFANTIPIIGSGPAGFKLRFAMGMVNNPALIWISWCGGFDFAFIVFYGTFKGISNEYSEAAKIDGANNLYIMFGIVVPQALPSVVAIAITQAIGVWNDYSTSMIYMREYPSLAYGLYLNSGKASSYGTNSKSVYFATAIISSIPVIVLYACNQKLILENMTAGGLKG